MQIGTHEVTSLSLSTYPKQPSKLFHSPHTLTRLASWYSHDAYMSHPLIMHLPLLQAVRCQSSYQRREFHLPWIAWYYCHHRRYDKISEISGCSLTTPRFRPTLVDDARFDSGCTVIKGVCYIMSSSCPLLSRESESTRRENPLELKIGVVR